MYGPICIFSVYICVGLIEDAITLLKKIFQFKQAPILYRYTIHVEFDLKTLTVLLCPEGSGQLPYCLVQK